MPLQQEGLDPDDPADTPTKAQLTLSLYVDDFIYFSPDSAVEHKFQCLLQQWIVVDFMGNVEWFLGTHFQWLVGPEAVKVHLSQSGFASHLVKVHDVHLCNVTPDATPYQSGIPLTLSLNPKKLMILLHSSHSIVNTRELLVPLGGSPTAHAPI